MEGPEPHFIEGEETMKPYYKLGLAMLVGVAIAGQAYLHRFLTFNS